MASEIPLVTSHVGYQKSLSTAKDKFMPSDRVWKKITNYMEIFGGKIGKKRANYTENTLDYAEISTVNKIDN